MAQAPFCIWKVGDVEYKLRIDTATAIALEKELGKSLLEALEEVTSRSVIITFLWGAIQKFHHGVQKSDMYEIYDRYIDEGGTLESTVDVIMETLTCSGFMSRNDLLGMERQRRAQEEKKKADAELEQLKQDLEKAEQAAEKAKLTAKLQKLQRS